MVTLVDAILFFLIFLTYGVGDVVTTVYGMRVYDLTETNPVLVWLFGEQFGLGQSVLAKIVPLLAIVLFYLLVRALYAPPVSRLIWWSTASVIILVGIGVTFSNWRAYPSADS